MEDRLRHSAQEPAPGLLLAELKHSGEALGSTVRAWNGASLRVLEKLGFTTTGDVEPDPVHGDPVLLRIAL